MLELSERILELLFSLPSTTIYAAVGLLCWAEAAFFLGFVTPGDLAVAAGGALAYRGQVTLGWLVPVAVAGTLLGNATGYFLGRRWGARILDSTLLQRLLGTPIAKARDFMTRRGEWAIVLGRLTPPTRIVVPFLAGASGLPYRRYILFDIPTTVVWAVVWGLLGFALGGSWQALQEAAGAAAFLVLALFIAALAIRWLAARIAANQLRAQAAFRRLLVVTGVGWVSRRVTPMLGWLGRRFDPRIAHGLSLTVWFLALIGAVGAVGLVLNQTRAVWGLARLDFPTLEWMAATRTEDAVRIARAALTAFHWPEVLFGAIPGIIFIAWRAGFLAALRVGTGLLGASGGAFFLDRFVLSGPVPHAEYPSVTVAVAAAFMTHATASAARKWGWGASVATAATAFFLVCTVALATLVAGWAAPTGIVLGFAIGLGWATTLELPGLVLRSGSPGPHERGDGGGSQAPDGSGPPGPREPVEAGRSGPPEGSASPRTERVSMGERPAGSANPAGADPQSCHAHRDIMPHRGDPPGPWPPRHGIA